MITNENYPKLLDLALNIPKDAVAYVFDHESNGFLGEADRIHCGWAYELNTKHWLHGYSTYLIDEPDIEHLQVEKWVERLQEADYLIGQNILGHDLPMIKEFYPWFDFKGIVLDTSIISQLAYPDRDLLDSQLIAKGKMTVDDFTWYDSRDRNKNDDPKKKNAKGKHSLKSWGLRSGNLKDDFEGDFEVYTKEMDDYCKQDVIVNIDLFKHLLNNKHRLTNMSMWIEHETKKILMRQELYGVGFDRDKGERLYAELLASRKEVYDKITETFGDVHFSKWERWVPKVMSRKNKWTGYLCSDTTRTIKEHVGYEADVPLMRDLGKTVPFNPGSDQHIIFWFMKKYPDWKPLFFNKPTVKFPAGQPKVDEEVLLTLPYPEAKLIAEWMMLDKRCGAFDGDKGWWTYLSDEDRIHGRVIPMGTGTGRMTHNSPNLAQVPKNDPGVPYGKECRELFIPKKGKVIVGCDASGLELRCLGHHMNDPKYIKDLLEGDIHTVNSEILGISRDHGKRWVYAYLYGAGVRLLGAIVGKGPGVGSKLKNKFLKGMPYLNALINMLQKVLNERNYIKQVDGRRILIRSKHSALNFLLQGLGAIIMKVALVLLDDALRKEFTEGVDFEFLLNVHDEFQIECDEKISKRVGELAEWSIKEAGVFLNLNVPLEGEAKVGDSWAETH